MSQTVTTVLQLINKILVRLRESEVGTVDETDYSLTLLRLLNDAKRGKLFAKLIRAIEVAAKQGGTDPAINASLNHAIQKAKSNSLPIQNIENALKRLTGDTNNDDREEIYYEGYGPSGIAFYVYCITDNKNRTLSDVKSTFTKNNGNIGNPGSVSYLFERKGIFELTGDTNLISHFAIENNCLDISEQYGNIVIEVLPSEYISFKNKIKTENFKIINSDIPFLPTNNVLITNGVLLDPDPTIF